MDLLARELGNWRTSSRSGPAYHGLADAIRLLIVDGRLPVGARLPSERALADTLRVSRTTVTAAYAQLRDDGYLNARRGARSTTALPVAPAVTARRRGAVDEPGRGGLSAPAAAVMEAFADAARDVTPYLHEMGHELVGVIALRQAIAERYCERGLPTEPDEVMVTTGALHAISLILTTYVQPGDRVLVEQPTYHGALSAITTAGARPVPVAMTEDGWELDALQAAVHQLSPSLAYLIPDNHNPTGLTMPAADRKRLARIIAETRTRTIIDETILDMWLDEPVPPPMAAAMTTRRDLVLTVGSMSKSFWGGLRVGWIRAERATIATIAALRPSIDMGTAGPRTVRRRKASRAARRAAAGAARDPSGPAGVSAVAAAAAPARLAARARRRRDVAVGAVARADEHRAVGCRVAAGAGPARRTAVRGRRHAGALRAGALRAARGPATAAIELLARAWHSVTGSTAPEPTTVVGRLGTRRYSSVRESSTRASTCRRRASAASISPRVMPRMNSTVSRYGWLSDASATSRSAGLALNATPRPGRGQHVDVVGAVADGDASAPSGRRPAAQSPSAPWPFPAGR